MSAPESTLHYSIDKADKAEQAEARALPSLGHPLLEIHICDTHPPPRL